MLNHFKSAKLCVCVHVRGPVLGFGTCIYRVFEHGRLSVSHQNLLCSHIQNMDEDEVSKSRA